MTPSEPRIGTWNRNRAEARRAYAVDRADHHVGSKFCHDQFERPDRRHERRSSVPRSHSRADQERCQERPDQGDDEHQQAGHQIPGADAGGIEPDPLDKAERAAAVDARSRAILIVQRRKLDRAVILGYR
jgi:hypothetical protein